MAQMDASIGDTGEPAGAQSGSGAMAWREAEEEVYAGGLSLLFSSRYCSALETIMRASPAATVVCFSAASRGDCGDCVRSYVHISQSKNNTRSGKGILREQMIWCMYSMVSLDCVVTTRGL